jgi:hypothetical protein
MRSTQQPSRHFNSVPGMEHMQLPDAGLLLAVVSPQRCASYAPLSFAARDIAIMSQPALSKWTQSRSLRHARAPGSSHGALGFGAQ